MSLHLHNVTFINENVTLVGNVFEYLDLCYQVLLNLVCVWFTK